MAPRATGGTESMCRMWLRPARHARPLPRVRRQRTDGGGHVKRKAFSALVVVSLTFAIAGAALWLHSYRPVEDYLLWRGETTTFIAHSKRGRIWFQHWRGAVPVPTRPASWDVVWAMRGTTNTESGRPIEIGFSPPPPALRNGFGFVWFETT